MVGYPGDGGSFSNSLRPVRWVQAVGREVLPAGKAFPVGIDSSGLGEEVRAMKRARQAGGDLRLCGVREDVLQLFEMTRLNKAIAIYPTRRSSVFLEMNRRSTGFR